VVVTAAVASLLALACYLWHRRRKTRLRSEKPGHTDLAGETAPGTKQMPVVAGATIEPYIIEPFYTPVPNPGQGRHHPNITPVFKPQILPPPHPESSSSGYYYSETNAPSTSSSPPSGYSPPPNQTQFAPLHFNSPSSTTIAAYTTSTGPDSRATPWATSILGETAHQSGRAPAVVDPSISKARYSGATATTSLGASSTSHRPLSPPPIDDSVPPPQYEL
jgi:hypothetical protein